MSCSASGCGIRRGDQCTLKTRFIDAVKNGELGSLEAIGLVVTLKEFKAYFSDIKTQYVASFLPAATFEPGQFRLTQTKFVFRVRRGVYLLHADLLQGDDIGER